MGLAGGLATNGELNSVSAGGGLLASNNLSDVSNEATALSNLVGSAIQTIPYIATAPDPYMIAGAIAETVPRRSALSGLTNALQTGKISGFAVYLPTGKVITSITFTAAGASASGQTNWWFELRDNSYALLGHTADQLTASFAANAAKTIALTSQFTTTYTGLHHLTMMMAASSATCGLLGITAGAAAVPMLNTAPVLAWEDVTHTGLTGPGTVATATPANLAGATTGQAWAYCS